MYNPKRIHREKATGSNCTLYYDYICLVSIHLCVYRTYDIQLKKLCYAEQKFSFPILFSKKGDINSQREMLHHVTCTIFKNVHTPHTQMTSPIIFSEISHFFFAIQPCFVLQQVYHRYFHFYRIYCGRKHPWLTCSRKSVKNGCADNAQSQYELCYVLYMCECIQSTEKNTHGKM